MFKRILVPLDGSTFAEAALPMAMRLSRRTGADLELITVHEPIPSFAYDEWESAAEEWSIGYLSEVGKRLQGHTGGAIESVVRSGRVSEALARRAEETHVDLIVMATHGRGALTRAWLGSVADAFVRHAPCPVILVRPEEGGPPDLEEEPPLETILVPLDGSELSEAIVEPASALAETFGARLVLLRAVAYPLEIASPYLPHTVQMNQEIVEEAREAAISYLESAAVTPRERGIEVEVEATVDAQAGHAILKALEEWKGDLVAMSTHGRGGVARVFLGSAADKVIRGAHKPVLVFRPESR